MLLLLLLVVVFPAVVVVRFRGLHGGLKVLSRNPSSANIEEVNANFRVKVVVVVVKVVVMVVKVPRSHCGLHPPHVDECMAHNATVPRSFRCLRLGVLWFPLARSACPLP